MNSWKWLPAFCLLCSCLTPALAGPGEAVPKEEITIYGLKIFKPEFLTDHLQLHSLPAGRERSAVAARAIENFYRENGYARATAFPLQENAGIRAIFVDEGRIGRIVFKNLNAIDTIRMRYRFPVYMNIYHEPGIRHTAERIRKHYNFKRVEVSTLPARNYDQSAFQLNRPLTIPSIGTFQLAFLDKYSPRYDMEVSFYRFTTEESAGIRYGIRTSYSKGLKPYASYTIPSIITNGDSASISASAGIMYGINLKFADLPYWTFMQLDTDYSFTPTLGRIFTPQVGAYVYRSWSSREDLGLDSYEYLIMRGTLEPGITLLQQLKIYAGYGAERVHLYNSDVDREADFYVDIEENVDYWHFWEARMTLDIIPLHYLRPTEKNLKAAYRFYFNRENFHIFKLEGKIEYEFRNFNMLSLCFDYSRLAGQIPFYHEVQVDSDTFKGFMGKSYHSDDIFRASSEFRVSTYRDYLYAGVFLDYTAFKGSGYDLSGRQNGIAFGISGHVVFLDQFEINLYFGRDYLFSEEESQYNFQMSAHKKW